MTLYCNVFVLWSRVFVLFIFRDQRRKQQVRGRAARRDDELNRRRGIKAWVGQSLNHLFLYLKLLSNHLNDKQNNAVSIAYFS